MPKLKEKDLSAQSKELRVLSRYPLAYETKVHHLNELITPVNKMFVRNNGIIPALAYQEKFPQWRLRVDGEVDRSYDFSLQELKKNFEHHSYQIVLECGGNGRAGFYPRGKGLQWKYGAVANIQWKGVLLKDVLESLGVKSSAVYLAYEAHDQHLSRDPKRKLSHVVFPLKKLLIQ